MGESKALLELLPPLIVLQPRVSIPLRFALPRAAATGAATD
jgi:hypothetical protein